MIKTKSIFSRAISVVLALLMILSTLAVGITATSAAEVQLAETGWTFSNAYPIFDNTNTNWSAVSILVGNSDTDSTAFTLTKISNTNLYGTSSGLSHTNNPWQVCFIGASWSGKENNSVSSRRGYASNYTAIRSTGADISGVCYAWGASSSNNCTLTFGTTTSGYSYYNHTYTASAGTGGTATVQGYKLNGNASSTAVAATSSAALAKTSTATFKATPSTGYIFEGWYTGANGTGTLVSSSATYAVTVGSENYTLYAKFKQGGKTVTFDMNGHGGDNETVGVTTGETIPTDDIPAPTETGYDFGGWFTDQACTTAFDFATAINDDITLYAKWTQHVYFHAGDTVFFDVSGNTEFYTAQDGTKTTRLYIAFTNSTVGSTAKTGRIELTQIGQYLFSYTFTEDCTSSIRFWRGTSDAEGGSMWNYSPELTECSDTVNGVYQTGWSNTGSTQLFTLGNITPTPSLTASSTSFDLGGSTTLTASTSSTPTLSYTRGTTSTTSTLVDATYTFKAGATTLSSSTSKTYSWTPASAGTYSTTVTLSSPALSALGVAGKTSSAVSVSVTTPVVTYTVTFDANGHGTAPTAQQIEQGKTATQPTAPTAQGYTFGGWYTTSACTTAFNFSTAINADTTVYAKWTANTSTINFVAGANGTVTNAGSTSVTYPNTKGSTATANTGYQFSGWTITGGTLNTDYKITSGSTSTVAITIQPLTSGKTITATANFTIKTFTVTFNANGNGTAPAAQTVNYGDTPTKPADLTASGYEFLGWYTSATGSTEFDFSAPITASTTVYAQWAADRYVRGTISATAWDASCKMTYDKATGKYTYATTLSAGSYEYKIGSGESSNWTYAYPSSNQSLNLVADSTVIFTFDPSVPEVTVEISAGEATVNVTQNVAVGTVTVGSTTISTASGSATVYQGVSASVTVTAPAGYYIASISGTAGCTATNVTSYSGNTATITASGGTIVVTYAANPTVTITQNGATGTATATPSTVNYNGSYILSVTAPEGYYISSIVINGSSVYTNDDTTKRTFSRTFAGITSDKDVVVNYAQRVAHTITIAPYSTANGVLKYDGNSIPAAGQTITVYEGDSVTITAEPNTGCTVYYWLIDDNMDGNALTYTLSDINADHTLYVEWKELSTYTVTVDAQPGGAGVATGTYGGTTITDHTANNSVAVTERENISFTETHTGDLMELYTFTGWTIDGTYTLVSGSLDSSSEALVISPTSDITVTATYEKTHRYIYLIDAAGWGRADAHFWNSEESHLGGPWPGTQMVYDMTNSSGQKIYRVIVPLNAEQIMFSNNGASQTASKTLPPTQNMYNNSTGSWYTYIHEGYYVIGKWNDAEHKTEELNRLIANGDGTYSYTIDVDTTYDGYIYINICDENSNIFNAATNLKTDNPQTLVAANQYLSYADRNKVKIMVDPTNPDGKYSVKLTFNANTKELSWEVVESVDTIQVNGYDGTYKNQSDDTTDQRVGHTYFLPSEDATVETTQKTDHQEALVKEGEPVSIYTQVNATNGAYNYYVEGWVVNGTEFISATSLGNGLYTGVYSYSQDLNYVVPVYFHTPEWLKAHNVEMMTIYAVTDPSTDFWNEYMAAYTWYKNSEGATVYEQFGKWQGQLMIPIAGLDGVYYTYVEDKAFDGTTISGVTFDNYYYESYGDVQAYDYYEFVALKDAGKSNITFVLKSSNTDYNKDKISGTSNINLSNFSFVPFVDYNEDKTDIFGNSIENTYDSLSDSNALYVVRTGYNQHTTDPLNGSFYVDCYFYDANGTYLGTCVSYEIKDPTSDIWDVVGSYSGQKVYVSYEAENGGRFDGQWYGDASVSTTVAPSVQVALSEDGGASYTVSPNAPLNIDDYGTAYINGSYRTINIVRGEMFTVSATPKAGYKFVGWYTEDGKLFSEVVSISLKAAVGATYTAVFEPLAAGEFYVNHYIYNGVGTSAYVPTAHKGEAQLYVGITNVTQNLTSALSKRNTASIAATQGDELLITIATNASGADKFFAWYVDAKDKYGLTTFEEVGVDTDDNLYNNGETVVGRNDTVYFQFTYIVGSDFSLNLYSDLIHVSVDTTLIYKYYNRYGEEKFYYVPYTLTNREIEGFGGNGSNKYTPAYISSPTGEWINSVLANAPFVEDYYKDAVWTITKSTYDSVTYELSATHTTKTYTVSLVYGGVVLVSEVPFNEVYSADIKAIDPSITSRGYWYIDKNSNGHYDADDVIIGNTMQIAYRVTQDLTISFETVDSMDFDIVIDEPSYGREQTTNTSGVVTKDIIYIDYMTNILVPYYPNGANPYGSAQEGTDTFAENYYDGKLITDGLQHSAVTIETLEHYGYTVSFGLILEQVGSYKVTEDGTYTTYEAAEAAAVSAGYGTATAEATLKDLVSNNQTGMQGGKYYSFIDATNDPITNKNRVLITLTMNNTVNNRAKFYNVYGYVIVESPDGTTNTYISAIQTLNIYNAGTQITEG